MRMRQKAQDAVSVSLQAPPVVEAIMLLGTLPVGKRADEFRDLLLKWRAGASVQGEQRAYLRKVAAQFGIPLPGNTTHVLPLILHEIAEAFKARASALRRWRPGTGSGVSAAAARGNGAGEPAFGVSGAAPDGAPMGKRKANGPA